VNHFESGFAVVTNSRINRRKARAGNLYGKVFDSIYDGTLYGHWEAIVTMQQLIVLASPDGVIDMTPQAIAARTSIPLDIIKKGLSVLESPDPYSRTPGEDGRRIIPLDEHRPWGWKLVNHGKYMRLRNMEQKREADRTRIAEKRKKNRYVASESLPVAHSDSDLDSKNKTKAPPDGGNVWDLGKTLLHEQGLSLSAAGALIGSWLREWPEAEVSDAIRSAAGKADVRSYVGAILKTKARKGHRSSAPTKVAM
jgi:hypothetical protein